MSYPLMGDPDACERAFQLANDKYWNDNDEEDDDESQTDEEE